MSELSLDDLMSALSGTTAGFRSVTRLQPLEGVGGKIFPATYSGGVYATEKRRVADSSGQPSEVDCVVIDSVQSQSNRGEEALKVAIERGQIFLPLIEVDFSGVNGNFKTPIQNLTSLDVPHRLADAILRDSELADGTLFSSLSTPSAGHDPIFGMLLLYTNSVPPHLFLACGARQRNPVV